MITRLGSHDFRRHEMAQIDADSGPNKDAKTRGLGANPLVVQKYYKNAQNQSHQRTLQVDANISSLRSASMPAEPAVNEGIGAKRVEGDDAAMEVCMYVFHLLDSHISFLTNFH